MRLLTRRNYMSVISAAIGLAATMIILAKVCANIVVGMARCHDAEYMNIIVRACWIDMFVALMVIVIAGRNHMLFVVSSLRSSAHNIAIRRCFGAGRDDVLRLTLMRGLIIVLLALAGAIVIITVVMSFFKSFVCVEVEHFLHPYSLAAYGVTLCMLVLGVGVAPGFVYNSLPLTFSSQARHKSRRTWKMGILSMQMLFFNIMLAMSVTIYHIYNSANFNLYYNHPHEHVMEFGNTITVGCVGAALMLFLGLLFYMQQEVDSRSKEMAIRRICGCSRQHMVWIVLGDCVKVIIPISLLAAVIAVLLISFVFSDYLVSMERPWMFVISIHIALNFIFVLTLAVKAYSVINVNPVKKLRYE